MTVKLDQVLLVIGGLLLALALTIGIFPVNAGGANCGTALTGVSQEARIADLTRTLSGGINSRIAQGDLLATQHSCSDAIDSRRMFALMLGVPGLLLLGAALLVKRQETSTTT